MLSEHVERLSVNTKGLFQCAALAPLSAIEYDSPCFQCTHDHCTLFQLLPSLHGLTAFPVVDHCTINLSFQRVPQVDT